MAVHTPLTPEALAQACARFGLSAPLAWRGIPEGSQNTLYKVEVSEGRFVLRLSEGRSDREVEFELGLLEHLARAGFPCPLPRPARSGRLWELIEGRHACAFPFMAGEQLSRERMTDEHAERVGEQIGHLHVLAEAYASTLPNRYFSMQIASWAEELQRADDPQVRAAAPAWIEESRAPRPALPQGTVHADVFMDNVLWLGDRVSAILDFEMACTDALALDIAIALCAWCYGDQEFVRSRARALLRGYQSRRRLTGVEKSALHGLARFAAARYAVTRVRDFHLSELGADRLVKKDWRRYRDRLLALREMGPDDFAGLVFS